MKKVRKPVYDHIDAVRPQPAMRDLLATLLIVAKTPRNKYA